MAKTYSAIQTITLGSSQGTVSFSNIPQNFTDLKLVMSARTDAPSNQADNIKVAFNGGSYSTSATINLYSTGSAAGSETNPGSLLQIAGTTGGTSTASTFGNSETYIPNYTSTSSKSIYADSVTENNATAAVIWLTASLFSTSSPITSMTLAPRLGSNFVAGSTFTLYGIGQGAKATGGTVVGAGNYIYHTFTSSGTFQPTEAIKNAEILAVAGGGGGGGNAWGRGSGGGGAGGVLWTGNSSFIAGTPYPCLVGAGGTGGTNAGSGTTSTASDGNNGSNSQILSSAIALGGGGGSGNQSGGSGKGKTGGSGGGNAEFSNIAGGLGTSGQGNNGGATTAGYGATGGGGAGGAGVDRTSNASTNGGVGTTAYSSWHYATQTGVNVNGAYYIAAGGGGGKDSDGGGVGQANGIGGLGGGGTGAVFSGTDATAGTANTGSGGGGGGGDGGARGASAAGGSGLIIIRYPVN